LGCGGAGRKLGVCVASYARYKERLWREKREWEGVWEALERGA
jgi:hypothetical protein